MPAEALLDRRARPGRQQAVIITLIALCAGVGGVWLTRALDAATQPGWPLSLGIGAGIALGVVIFAMQGARVVVGADGQLTYTLQGRQNLVFPLAAASVFRPVDQGLVRGIGVELPDVRAVRFLHKAGISPERMRLWREQFGVDLILEGFPPALADELTALRKAAPVGAGMPEAAV